MAQVRVIAGPNPLEWLFLELQGKLAAKDASLADVTLGNLSFGEGGRVSLRIGNLLLSGARTPLAKPLAVCEKTRDAEGRPVIKVIGVIRSKLLFRERPQPIVKVDAEPAGAATKAEPQPSAIAETGA